MTITCPILKKTWLMKRVKIRKLPVQTVARVIQMIKVNFGLDFDFPRQFQTYFAVDSNLVFARQFIKLWQTYSVPE